MIRDPMSFSLENKLALIVWYLTEVRSGRRDRDEAALHSYLDDAEVAEWLSRMNKEGCTKNTRFLAGRK